MMFVKIMFAVWGHGGPIYRLFTEFIVSSKMRHRKKTSLGQLKSGIKLMFLSSSFRLKIYEVKKEHIIM